MPSIPSTLAYSCGSITIAPVPCGTTARTNSGIVTIVLSTWKCPSIKLGARYAPFEIDHLFRFVITEADDASVIDRDVRIMNFAAEAR